MRKLPGGWLLLAAAMMDFNFYWSAKKKIFIIMTMNQWPCVIWWWYNIIWMVLVVQFKVTLMLLRIVMCGLIMGPLPSTLNTLEKGKFYIRWFWRWWPVTVTLMVFWIVMSALIRIMADPFSPLLCSLIEYNPPAFFSDKKFDRMVEYYTRPLSVPFLFHAYGGSSWLGQALR